MTARRAATHKRSRGRPTSHGRLELDRAILEAATAAFIAFGYERASMDEIAIRAGTSKQSVYARFPSKAELFEAFIDFRFRHVIAPSLLDAANDSRSPKEFLNCFGCELLENTQSKEGQKLLRVVVSAFEVFPGLATRFWRRGPGHGRELLGRYLESQNELGLLSISNPDRAADQFIGLLFGAPILRFAFGGSQLLKTKTEIVQWVETAVDLFLSYYASGGNA